MAARGRPHGLVHNARREGRTRRCRQGGGCLAAMMCFGMSRAPGEALGEMIRGLGADCLLVRRSGQRHLKRSGPRSRGRSGQGNLTRPNQGHRKRFGQGHCKHLAPPAMAIRDLQAQLGRIGSTLQPCGCVRSRRRRRRSVVGRWWPLTKGRCLARGGCRRSSRGCSRRDALPRRHPRRCGLALGWTH